MFQPIGADINEIGIRKTGRHIGKRNAYSPRSADEGERIDSFSMNNGVIGVRMQPQRI